MKLSPHFSLSELTASAKAEQLGLSNQPPPEVVPRLILLADLLERIREHLAAPMTITSGYRGAEVNRAVGGVTSSDHTRGDAADFVAPKFGTPYDIAKALAPMIDALGVGQVIYEGFKRADGSWSRWCHVSTRTPANVSSRVITISSAGTRLGVQVVA